MNGKKVFSLKIIQNSCGIFFPSEIPALFHKNERKKNIYNTFFKELSMNPPYFELKILSSRLLEKLNNIIKKSTIVYFHAETFFPNLNIKNKKIIFGASGNPYRKNPQKFINELSIYPNSKLLLQCPDLLGYNTKIPEYLVYYGVDTDFIKFKERLFEKKLIISHYATNNITKGTESILKAIDKIIKDFPNRFEYRGIQNTDYNKRIQKGSVKLNWVENIKRMSECDIYIETCNLDLNGKKFGEWGNTCLEAAATGCIVITNSLTKDLYKREYTEDYPLLISNNTIEIYNNLLKLSNFNREELKELSKKYRDWVEKNHSLKVTGKRFIEKLF